MPRNTIGIVVAVIVIIVVIYLILRIIQEVLAGRGPPGLRLFACKDTFVTFVW